MLWMLAPASRQVKRVQRKPQAADLALVQAVTTSSWWRCAKTGQEDIEGVQCVVGACQDRAGGYCRCAVCVAGVPRQEE
eukprot:1161248-Pelagomonas_calceolata.AAC.4